MRRRPRQPWAVAVSLAMLLFQGWCYKVTLSFLVMWSIYECGCLGDRDVSGPGIYCGWCAGSGTAMGDGR